MVVSLSATTVFGQDWMPVIRDVHGDTIRYHYPPSDSLYVKNKIIIKFKESALNKSFLCYSCNSDTSSDSNVALVSPGSSPYISYYNCRTNVLAQQFAVDSGILLSSPLAAAMKSYGGTYLRRMTAANPCSDTLSITRLGDTIGVDYYTWMTLDFNNDTSAVTACVLLNMLFRSTIDIADLNYICEPTSAVQPNDFYYKTLPKQISLTPNLIGTPTAWGEEVGTPDVMVAVIDNSIDYRHCDLGGNGQTSTRTDKTYTDKVVGGWNYNLTPNAGDTTLVTGRTIYLTRALDGFPSHGTAVTGIIAAMTNNVTDCPVTNLEGGVAGIAGGWGVLNGDTYRGTGVSVLGYRTNNDLAQKISAILEAIPQYSNNSAHGDAAHIINASWGGKKSSLDGDTAQAPYSETCRRAVYEAYRNKASFVAGRGNNQQQGASILDNTEPFYPASYDGNWVISVGASKRDKVTRNPESQQENLSKSTANGRFGVIDIMAPGGEHSAQPANERTVFTTGPVEVSGTHQYVNFYQTSAATAHVSGVAALMRSSVVKAPHYFTCDNKTLEPEDYEGIIQATAYRLDGGKVYDKAKGWGHLQADNVYNNYVMQGYRTKHYETITGISSIIDSIPIPERQTVFSATNYNPANNYVFTSDLKYDTTDKRWKAQPEITTNQSTIVGHIRQITRTYLLKAGDWDTTQKLFVWARGGTGGSHNAANPNHRSPWSEVINGTGGSTSNPNSNDTLFVPGIFHNNSLEVKCRGYQYQIVNTITNETSWFPADDELQFHFTVYGKFTGTPASVRLSDEIPIQPKLSIKPNPASEHISVEFALAASSHTSLEIIDVLGRIVVPPVEEYNTSGTYSQTVNVSALPQGVYFCKLTCNGNGVFIKSFIVE